MAHARPNMAHTYMPHYGTHLAVSGGVDSVEEEGCQLAVLHQARPVLQQHGAQRRGDGRRWLVPHAPGGQWQHEVHVLPGEGQKPV
eukprot:7381370-Prymnesium_polylepis.1